MLTLIKEIFTWWNHQTFGTRLQTLLFGKLVGQDNFGNKYYQSKNGKRWIIYKDEVDASKIPNEWYSWIHFTNNILPVSNQKKYFWEKKHVPNLTGTSKAYRPKKIIESKNIKKKYESWKV